MMPAGQGDAVRDHGGALARAEARFGRPSEPWLDLSTGINPWSYPVPPLEAALWQRLPDDDLIDGTAQAAARAYGCPVEAVAAAPGSQALIQVLPRLFAPQRVAVIEPTYAEHARCWRRAGHLVDAVGDLDQVTGETIVVLANPNNPDGRSWPASRLTALAAALAARGGLLVVDEAFVDTAPELSLAAAAGRPGLCLLRSFGKFYGLAGLRLGFALAEPALAAALAAELGPWAVSGPALAIGRAALADAPWQQAMRRRLDAAAADLDRLLGAAGFTVLGGTSLFRLVEHGQAADAHGALARRGIWVRAFDARPDWLRFGLPPDAAATGRLARALAPPA